MLLLLVYHKRHSPLLFPALHRSLLVLDYIPAVPVSPVA
jgi:hypothetical protein